MKKKIIFLSLIAIALGLVVCVSTFAADSSRAPRRTYNEQANGTTQSSVNHYRPRHHRCPYPYYPYTYGYILPPAPTPAQAWRPPGWTPTGTTSSYFIGPIYYPRPCPYPYIIGTPQGSSRSSIGE